MMARNQFFQKLESEWGETSKTRSKYQKGIPLQPIKSYFDKINSIDELAELLVRPIEKPLWLGVHAIGYLINAMLNAVAIVVLAPFALVGNIAAPKSEFTIDLNKNYCSLAANAIVSMGMSLIAAASAVVSLTFNPLFVVCRGVGTVMDEALETFQPCFS